MNNRISVATIDSPEFINLKPMDLNPLMSKCEVKVLYVGLNRNNSYIDKATATEMSKTLRGCPIVGQYTEDKGDFEDHGDQVIINSDGIKFSKLTKPYGFVAPDAKVWFQFFEDKDEYGNTCLREYLMTEAYLWTGQFKECGRVIENHNPQSMELDEETLKGYWTTDDNRGVDFFIINDAIFSKLCILGEDVEPCFEGSSFSEPNLSSKFNKDNEFTKSLFSMMNELKFALNNSKGGKPMPKNMKQVVNGESSENQNTQFEADGAAATAESAATASVTGGDHGVDTELPVGNPDTGVGSAAGDPAVDGNISGHDGVSGGGETVQGEGPAAETHENEGLLVEDSIPSTQKELEFEANDTDSSFEKKDNEDVDKDDKSDSDDSEDNIEDEEEKEEEKKKDYTLLEEELSSLKNEYSLLKEEYAKLLAFKQEVENKEKDVLIESFYMLSDEDKKNVIENKANYSLKEIKAELSMICVDKKVNFNLESQSNSADDVLGSVTYNLDSHQADGLPAWLRAVENVKKNK